MKFLTYFVLLLATLVLVYGSPHPQEGGESPQQPPGNPEPAPTQGAGAGEEGESDEDESAEEGEEGGEGGETGYPGVTMPTQPGFTQPAFTMPSWSGRR